MNRIDTDTQEDEEKKDKYKNIIQKKETVKWNERTHRKTLIQG